MHTVITKAVLYRSLMHQTVILLSSEGGEGDGVGNDERALAPQFFSWWYLFSPKIICLLCIGPITNMFSTHLEILPLSPLLGALGKYWGHEHTFSPPLFHWGISPPPPQTAPFRRNWTYTQRAATVIRLCDWEWNLRPLFKLCTLPTCYLVRWTWLVLFSYAI